MTLLDALAQLAPRARSRAVGDPRPPRALARTPMPGPRSARSECAQRGIALSVRRVDVARAPRRRASKPRARAARYAALARADADVVAARASRRRSGRDAAAATAARRRARTVSPRCPSRAPAAAPPCCGRCSRCRARRSRPMRARRGIRWIDDESNADTGLRRNFLRHEIAPRLAAAFPGYPGDARARRGARGGGRALCSTSWRRIDARAAGMRRRQRRRAATLDRAALRRRSRSATRRARATCCAGFCAATRCRCRRRRGSRRCWTSSCAPRRMRASASSTPASSSASIAVASSCTRRRPRPIAVRWAGERSLALPHGTLDFGAVAGAGLAADAIAGAPVIVRPREGGERMRLALEPPAAALKHLLQEAGVPAVAARRTGRSSGAAMRWRRCPESASPPNSRRRPARAATSCAGTPPAR